MRCDEFVELLTAHLEGALDEATEQRFRKHLRRCKGCHRYLAQFRRTIAELGHLPAESITPAARDHLLSAFRDWSSG